jgi:ribose 5-phosphate isomerase B
MKIFLGADHNGFYLKNKLAEYLRSAGYEVVDDGDTELDPVDDFPVFAQKVVHDVLSSDDKDPRGILICSSGQGMCMAANRFKGIRALLGYDHESVRASRNDEDANILCLPSRILEKDSRHELVETFLSTPFEPVPRFKRRLREMDEF